VWKGSYSLGELHDGWKAGGSARVLNVIREFEHCECLTGLLDTARGRVWLRVYVGWDERAREPNVAHADTRAPLRFDSTNYLQHVSFPQKPGAHFSLLLVNASLSEGSFHVFREKRGNHISAALACELIREQEGEGRCLRRSLWLLHQNMLTL